MSILTADIARANLEVLRQLTAEFPSIIKDQVGNAWVILEASELPYYNLKLWEFYLENSTTIEVDGKQSWDFVSARLSLTASTQKGELVRKDKEDDGAWNFRLGGFCKVHSEAREGKARNVMDPAVLWNYVSAWSAKKNQTEKSKRWSGFADLKNPPAGSRILFQLELTEGQFKVPDASNPSGWQVDQATGKFVTVTRPCINLKNLFLVGIEFGGHGSGSEVDSAVLGQERTFARIL